MSEHSTALVDGLIHLPRVTENDQDELVDHLLRMSERLPEITIKVATKAMGKRWQQIAPHNPTALVVPLVEMIFDTDRAGLFEVELHAQFVFLSAFPTLPESMAMQIAFGRRTGEEVARKFARLYARAEQRGGLRERLRRRVGCRECRATRPHLSSFPWRVASQA